MVLLAVGQEVGGLVWLLLGVGGTGLPGRNMRQTLVKTELHVQVGSAVQL